MLLITGSCALKEKQNFRGQVFRWTFHDLHFIAPYIRIFKINNIQRHNICMILIQLHHDIFRFNISMHHSAILKLMHCLSHQFYKFLQKLRITCHSCVKTLVRKSIFIVICLNIRSRKGVQFLLVLLLVTFINMEKSLLQGFGSFDVVKN